MRLQSIEETRRRKSMVQTRRKKSNSVAAFIAVVLFLTISPLVKADTAVSVKICQKMDTPTFSNADKSYIHTARKFFVVEGNSGEKATVNEVVKNNGTAIYTGDSLSNGNFKHEVQLKQGDNSITVTALDACGNIKTSEMLLVNQDRGQMPPFTWSVLSQNLIEEMHLATWMVSKL